MERFAMFEKFLDTLLKNVSNFGKANVYIFHTCWYNQFKPIYCNKRRRERVQNLQILSPRGILKKGILKSFEKLTGKHLCWSLFLQPCRPEPADLQLYQKVTPVYFFPVNFVKICRKSVNGSLCFWISRNDS